MFRLNFFRSVDSSKPFCSKFFDSRRKAVEVGFRISSWSNMTYSVDLVRKSPQNYFKFLTYANN